MSTIIAANISDGTTSVPSTYVVNGSAKAWVNFNGTGTVAIRDSLNVSTITDNGTGDYTVNFTTAMTDADYAAFANSSSDASNISQIPVINFKGTGGYSTVAPTTTAFRFFIGTNTGTAYDQIYISATAFR